MVMMMRRGRISAKEEGNEQEDPTKHFADEGPHSEWFKVINVLACSDEGDRAARRCNPVGKHQG